MSKNRNIHRAHDEVMSFPEIDRRLGLSRNSAHQAYASAMRKLRTDPILQAVLQDLAGYHDQLKARSAESRWDSRDWTDDD